MISLALFRKIAEEGVAGLIKDADFFWEEAPLQKNGDPANGVWMVTRGGSSANSPKGFNLRTTIDFYVAFPNRVKTEAVQESILKWILGNPSICELNGEVGGERYSYSNIRLRPTTTPQNMGVTANGNIVKTASAEIIYDLTN